MTDTTREAVERLEVAMHSARPTQTVAVHPKNLAAILAHIRGLEGQLDVEQSTYKDMLRDNKRKAARIRELEAENAALRKEVYAYRNPPDRGEPDDGSAVWCEGKDDERINWKAKYVRLAQCLAASDWNPKPDLSALTPAPVSVGDVLREAQFLVDRLNGFELTDDPDEMAREYMGHIEPSETRLRAALRALADSETTAERLGEVTT